MRKIVIWLVPLALFGVILFSPGVTVAALTPPSAIWQQTIADTTGDVGDSRMDIAFVRHAFEGGFHYFEMELVGSPGGPPAFANSYDIYIKKGAGVSLFSTDYTVGYNNLYSVVTTTSGDPISVLEDGHSGLKLNWRTNAFAGSNNFSFMGVTLLSDAGAIDFTNSASAVVPIPGAAYLLGSGVIGLVGLRRRQAKRS